MRTSTSRTLRTLVVAASTTAVVALAGPAQAVPAPNVYIDGFGPHSNQACNNGGGVAQLRGVGLPVGGSYTVSLFALIPIAEGETDGALHGSIFGYGAKGKLPYRVDVYNAAGKHTLTKTLEVKWVKCVN